MAKKGEARQVIHLAPTDCPLPEKCGDRPYTTEKNKRNDPDRLELRKYCPRCRTHRLFRETR